MLKSWYTHAAKRFRCITFYEYFTAREIGVRIVYRINLPEVFCKKGVLKKFVRFTEKHLCKTLFLIKFQATLYLQNTSGGCLSLGCVDSIFLVGILFLIVYEDFLCMFRRYSFDVQYILCFKIILAYDLVRDLFVKCIELFL